MEICYAIQQHLINGDTKSIEGEQIKIDSEHIIDKYIKQSKGDGPQRK